MLEAISPERLPSVLSTLVDAGDNSLLHVAVARGAVPLALLLLDKVRRRQVMRAMMCESCGSRCVGVSCF